MGTVEASFEYKSQSKGQDSTHILVFIFGFQWKNTSPKMQPQEYIYIHKSHNVYTLHMHMGIRLHTQVSQWLNSALTPKS